MLNTYQIKKTRELQNLLAKKFLEKVGPQIKGFKNSYKCTPLQFIKVNYYYFETFGIDKNKILSRILSLPLEVEKVNYIYLSFLINCLKLINKATYTDEQFNAFTDYINLLNLDIENYEY